MFKVHLSRAEILSNIILNHSIGIKPGEKLLISASDFTSQELLLPLYREAIKIGAIVQLDIFGSMLSVGRADYGGFLEEFYRHSTDFQLKQTEVHDFLTNWADKTIRIVSIHNKKFLESIDGNKIALRQAALRPISDSALLKPWTLTYYPTKALAKNAGMTLKKFTEFYYEACNIDYLKMDEEILPLQNILDSGKIVHIKGQGIDLRLGIDQRLALGVDNGKHNIPDGECFLGPQEDKTEGFIDFPLPQIYNGKEVRKIHLEFKKGKLIKYSSMTNSAFLKQLLESNSGNKRLGEFGIGMNKNITKYIKDILFDEKIYGTVHFALGMAYPYERGGGKNKATIHWDLIKDLRHKGSVISVDDKVIFKDGATIYNKN